VANKPRLEKIHDDIYMLYNYRNHLLLTKSEILEKSPELISNSNGCYIINKNNKSYIEPAEYGMIVSSLLNEEIIDYVYNDYLTITIRTDSDDYIVNIRDIFTGEVPKGVSKIFANYVKESIIYQNMLYPKRYIKVNTKVIKLNGNVFDGKYYRDGVLETIDGNSEKSMLKSMLSLHGDLCKTITKREKGDAYILSNKYITKCNGCITSRI